MLKLILLATFIEGATIGVPTRTDNILLFANTYTQHYIPNYLYPNTWHRVDLSHLVPEDTKAVDLQGLVRITHGTLSPSLCMVTMAYRAPGDTKEVDYIMQVIETHRGHGQRTNVSAWVPVKDQAIEVKWTSTGTGSGANVYPIGCSLGFNLAVGAYLR